MPALNSVRKRWKTLLGVLGASATLDIVKEYFRGRVGDWVTVQLGPVGNWLLQNPTALFTIGVVLTLAWLVFKIIREHTTPTKVSLLVDENQQAIFPRSDRKPIIATIVLAFVAAVVITFGWYRYHESRARRRVPHPPTAFIGGTSSGLMPVRLNSGRVVRYTKRELPCAYGLPSGYGLEGIHKLPGGPSLKKPWLVLTPTNFMITDWQGGDRQLDFLFYVEITNRGDASIAKDYDLCLVVDGKPQYFRPENLDHGYLDVVKPEQSLAQNTARTAIEHGRLAQGWLLFRIPSGIIDPSSFAGSLTCRDYLERRASSLFSTPELEKKKQD